MQPAVVSFEQDKDHVNIEEEDPENKVQPDEADIGLDIDNEEHFDELLVEPNKKMKSTASVNLKRKLGSA